MKSIFGKPTCEMNFIERWIDGRRRVFVSNILYCPNNIELRWRLKSAIIGWFFEKYVWKVWIKKGRFYYRREGV